MQKSVVKDASNHESFGLQQTKSLLIKPPSSKGVVESFESGWALLPGMERASIEKRKPVKNRHNVF